jgi:hypothetical protein
MSYPVISRDGDVTMISPKRLPVLSTGLLVAALAACSAAIAQPAPLDREDAALAYAQCIRDNGYAEFPDPEPDGGLRFLIEPGNAPRFKTAAAACQDLAPEGMRDEGITSESLEALLRLSQCARENGVADFPDPDSGGRFDLSGVSDGLNDPRIQAAMDVCRDQAGGAPIMIGG